MIERARAAAEEILDPLRGERLEHEVYTVLARRVADAVAQATQQERNEGQVRLANAVAQAVKERDEALAIHAGAKAVLKKANEEIARLRAEAKLWEAYDTRTRYQRDKAEAEVVRLRGLNTGCVDYDQELGSCGRCSWCRGPEEPCNHDRQLVCPRCP